MAPAMERIELNGIIPADDLEDLRDVAGHLVAGHRLDVDAGNNLMDAMVARHGLGERLCNGSRRRRGSPPSYWLRSSQTSAA